MYAGQRHLIYILSVLASRPSVLIADEMLCGLDIDRQASVLTMLQRLQAHTGLAILFMSVDLAPVSIMVRGLGCRGGVRLGARRAKPATYNKRAAHRARRFHDEREGCRCTRLE
jgi:ABC-type lipoprotein export system ATPase subunit